MTYNTKFLTLVNWLQHLTKKIKNDNKSKWKWKFLTANIVILFGGSKSKFVIFNLQISLFKLDKTIILSSLNYENISMFLI